MLLKKRLTEEETLTICSVGLTNVESQARIAEIMEKEGFDVKSLTIGKQLLADAQEL